MDQSNSTLVSFIFDLTKNRNQAKTARNGNFLA